MPGTCPGMPPRARKSQPPSPKHTGKQHHNSKTHHSYTPQLHTRKTKSTSSIHSHPPRLSEKSDSQSAIGLLGHSGRGRTNRRGTFRTGSPTGTKKEAPTECYFNRDFRKAAAAYSPTWWGSTIGASELNFSVRYGKRWILTAITAAVCYLREISWLKSWLTQKISGY